MTHPGYDASDEEIITYWRSVNASVSLIDEVIKRDLEFKRSPTPYCDCGGHPDVQILGPSC